MAFKIFTILTILPFMALSQPMQIDAATASGEINAAGKPIKIVNGYLSNVTLHNAIIDANPFEQLFDTTVVLVNCKAREFSPLWYGMKASNADNSRYLQIASDMCIANGIKNFYIPSDNSYTITKEWLIKNIYNDNYVGVSLNVRGDGNIWNDATTLNYTGQYYAIGIQMGKGVSISGIAIKGNYQAPSLSLGQAYYNTPFPVRAYNAGIMIDYDGSKNIGGSTGISITDTWVDGFDVCYDVSPNGKTYNADIIRFGDIRVGNCRIGVRSGQAQEKGNEIRYIAAWGNTQILIQIGKSGKYQGGDYIVRGGNVAGGVVQLFDIQLSGWNKFSCYGLYAESVGRIGYFGSSTSQHRMPIHLEGLSVRLALKNQAGVQNVITSNAQRLKITNSFIAYYGVVGDTIRVSGNVIFDNCDFGASKLLAPRAFVFDNLNGRYFLPLNIYIGKMFYHL